ncbi:hypothetical protein [Flavobacterium sp. TBRC 19031]|uniref:hypothetical protein n=1 Tax=Flavobacterium mekongense TaxID=3379707 RepID=UPI00399B0DCF
MKKICSYIILVCFFSTFAQKKDQELITTKKRESNKDTIVLSTPSVLQIKSVSDNDADNFDWSKNMPWIGAIIIGLSTVVANIITSNLLRKSNSAAIKQQTENAKTISDEQLELARSNSERDFKKTVLSTTRQLWISDFRNILSELLSITAIFSLSQKMEGESNFKFNLYLTKAELMLTDSPNHSELKKQLDELKNCCLGIMMQTKSVEEMELIVSKIKTQTARILSEEWEKASKAE